MAAPSTAQLNAMIERICADAVRALVERVPDTSPEERARMQLGLANPTDEFTQHMDDFRSAIAELLVEGSVMAINGLNGRGFVLGDESRQD